VAKGVMDHTGVRGIRPPILPSGGVNALSMAASADEDRKNLGRPAKGVSLIIKQMLDL
jgi:hypothetical protein